MPPGSETTLAAAAAAAAAVQNETGVDLANEPVCSGELRPITADIKANLCLQIIQ